MQGFDFHAHWRCSKACKSTQPLPPIISASQQLSVKSQKEAQPITNFLCSFQKAESSENLSLYSQLFELRKLNISSKRQYWIFRTSQGSKSQCWIFRTSQASNSFLEKFKSCGSNKQLNQKESITRYEIATSIVYHVQMMVEEKLSGQLNQKESITDNSMNTMLETRPQRFGWAAS